MAGRRQPRTKKQEKKGGNEGSRGEKQGAATLPTASILRQRPLEDKGRCLPPQKNGGLVGRDNATRKNQEENKMWALAQRNEWESGVGKGGWKPGGEKTAPLSRQERTDEERAPGALLARTRKRTKKVNCAVNCENPTKEREPMRGTCQGTKENEMSSSRISHSGVAGDRSL